jgi:hypothetical protein
MWASVSAARPMKSLPYPAAEVRKPAEPRGTLQTSPRIGQGAYSEARLRALGERRSGGDTQDRETCGARYGDEELLITSRCCVGVSVSTAEFDGLETEGMAAIIQTIA